MSEFTDDDALAAEYVIGTLPGDEQAAASSRRHSDTAFAVMIREWADLLSPLLEAAPAVEPSARLRDAVLADFDRMHQGRSDDAPRPVATNVVALRRQVTRWRFATVLCGGLAALLAIWLATSRTLLPPAPGNYMAVLQQGAGGPAFLVSLDLANRRMTVVPADAPMPADKSYELWMIGTEPGGPRSLGIMDTPSAVRASLPDVSPDLISHAVYAVTVEPKGGSPSGKPTSAPVFAGHLVPMEARGPR